MPPVNEDDPDQRRMLTELRLQATKQIVVLAMASSAIPISVAGLINLERPNDVASPWWWFWTINEAGWSLMGGALVAGYICISAAPSWVRDKDSWHRYILVATYWIAPVCFVFGLLCLGGAAMIAIRYGSPVSHR